jgi:hypothetical protein
LAHSVLNIISEWKYRRVFEFVIREIPFRRYTYRGITKFGFGFPWFTLWS